MYTDWYTDGKVAVRVSSPSQADRLKEHGWRRISEDLYEAYPHETYDKVIGSIESRTSALASQPAGGDKRESNMATTPDDLSEMEREDLQFLAKRNAGVIWKDRQVRLESLGLITVDAIFSKITDAGRALVASQPAGAAGDADDFKEAFLNGDYDTMRELYDNQEADLAAAREQVAALRAVVDAVRDAYETAPVNQRLATIWKALQADGEAGE